MRPSLQMKVGNYYWGGAPVFEYRVAGVRVPRWVFRFFYRWMSS